jgi:hypothetical protein
MNEPNQNHTDETAVPGACFDALLEELDTQPEIVPALVRAAARRRARAAEEARRGFRPGGGGCTA